MFLGGFVKTAVSFKSFKVIRSFLKNSKKPMKGTAAKIKTQKEYDRYLKRVRKGNPDESRSAMSWLKRQRNRAWDWKRSEQKGRAEAKARLNKAGPLWYAAVAGVPALGGGAYLYQKHKERAGSEIPTAKPSDSSGHSE